jgi:hypothetical protein
VVAFFRGNAGHILSVFCVLAYTAVGVYFAQPGRFLNNPHSKRWGSLSYNSRVVSLFFLCLFELTASPALTTDNNPPFIMPMVFGLFLVYWLAAIVADYAVLKIVTLAQNIELNKECSESGVKQ